MKKYIALAVVCLLSICSLFAVEGFVGAKLGADFSWETLTMSFMGESNTSKGEGIAFGFGADGATYFTSGKNQFGIGYGLLFGKAYSQKQDGQEVSVDNLPLIVNPRVSFQYRNAINQNLYVGAGIGVSASFAKQSVFDSDSGTTNVIKSSTIGLLGNIEMQYKFNSKFGLRCGVEASTPLKNTIEITNRGLTMSFDVSSKGVSLMPYIGLSFLY